jgi:hypothetical protein
MNDNDLEYAKDLDRHYRRAKRQELINMQSDDYYTGMGDDEPDTDETN